MGILRRMQTEARATAGIIGSPRDPVIASWLGVSSMTAAGQSVTPESARRVAAVYACVRALALPYAAMPLLVWKYTAGGKERDPSHPLWPLLHDRPNRLQTSFEWREMMVGHLCLRGEAYSQILTRNDGVVDELLPLHPDRVQSFLAPDGRVAYRYTPRDGGPARILLDQEVLRFIGWSDDGITGLSPIALHRETIGRSMAIREYGSRMFSNSAAPKGGIKIPSALGPEAAAKLRESWEARHRGAENAGKLAIFDGGMEWVSIGMTNDDAQYIEALKFDIEEIARIYGVPPHKIGHLERSTNNNIEHQGIEFVTDSMLPLARRTEDRLNLSLLSDSGRQTHFIGLELKGLLRGDATARSNFYRALFNIGALSPNDALRAEDMDIYEGGDVRYVPLNMAPTDRLMDVLLKGGAKSSADPGAADPADPEDPADPPDPADPAETAPKPGT